MKAHLVLFAIFILIGLFGNFGFAHKYQKNHHTNHTKLRTYSVWLATSQAYSLPQFRHNIRELEEFTLLITGSRDHKNIPGFTRLFTSNGTNEAFLLETQEGVTEEELKDFSRSVNVLFRHKNYLIVSVHDILVLENYLIFSGREALKYIHPTRRNYQPLKNINVNGDVKDNVVALVDGYAVFDLIKQLSGATPVTVNGKQYTIKTRYSYSDELTIAGNFIESYFQSLGLQTQRQDVTVKTTKSQNIIGVKIGTSRPNEIVVVGAHYDSTSEKPTTAAPGAIDDGSGTAAVMHLANIFSKFSFERTIHFVAFTGEEQGLYGSAEYVSLASKNKNQVVTNALCMDMISYSSKYFGVTVEGTKSYEELIDAVDLNMKAYRTSNFTVAISKNSFGSDHVSFQKAGIPAILAIEKDDTDYPQYHKSGDSSSYVNVPQTTQIVKGIAGSLCDLAGVPL